MTATGANSSTPAAGAVRELVCPACAGGLLTHERELTCEQCARRFPVIAGIPDLRLGYPDPQVSLEEDRNRARELAARFEELDLAGLLRAHWRRSGKPLELTERFLARDLAAEQWSRVCLEQIERRRGAPLGPDDRFLEVGCGTAGLAAAAAGRAGRVVASDVSIRWLVLARKRLAEAGIEGVELVCCAAEQPALAPETFDLVVAGDVIEHAAHQAQFIGGCRRMLSPGGMLFIATPNRFSLGLEPHVRLWGVGYMPLGLARRYVRALRKAPYDHVRLLSARRLRRLLSASGLRAQIVAPEIPAATQRQYAGVELRLVRAYNRLRRRAPVHRLLLLIGPFFHVFATRAE